MTKQTIELQNKIQECKNILKDGYLPRNNVWKHIYGEICVILSSML